MSKKSDMRVCKDQKSKPQYGICSNMRYLLRLSRDEVPGLLFQQSAKVLASVVISVIGLYLSPTLLRLLEQRQSLEMLLKTLSVFALGLFTAHAVKGYLDQQWIRLVVARSCMVNRINAKVGSCSYPLLLDEEFRGKWGQGMEACDGSGSAAAEAIWRTMFRILENLICFGIYLALLTQVQPFLILITLFTTGLGYLISYHFVQKEYRFQEEAAEPFRREEDLLQAVRNSKLAKDVRIFGMREWLEGMHHKYLRLAEDIQKRRGISNLLADMAGLALDILRNGIAYAYLLAITLQGELSAGEFLLYFMAVTGFTAWITGILGGFTDLHRQSIEISAIREFIDYPEPFLMEGGKKPVLDSRGSCTFELRNVTYRYPNAEKPVLYHFNLTVKPGEKLAVVGANGAGKTTLIKLLSGFLDPDEGTVLLNGVDIREYDRREYYRLFSAVFQDFSILGGSIAENVAQCSSPRKDRVWTCLERAGVRERIERLPGGLDARLEKVVYPEAVELSGGELQRLMMARMLYKDAPVLLLDEPTAALDALAEQDIYQRYNELSQARTSVYISHRLASTRFCDRVLLLENGEIREEGTHEELMELGGRYAELFLIQSKYYREVGEEKEV
ncbi:MAG: ABC transporter ATP-binding protein/permease [bacterium]|nr:ABC transporter ATP-binding protein/permease [bacterium]